MRIIGRVIALQIAPETVITGLAAPNGYAPERLTRVESVELSPEGVTGLKTGERILDIHHTNHQRSRRREAKKNAVSFNFSHHYDAMRTHLSERIFLGCGAENILIQTLDEPFNRLQTSEVFFGEGILLAGLGGAYAAPPCVPFVAWALKSSDGQKIKHGLKFLIKNVRCYYGQVEQVGVVKVGDEVWVNK